LTKAKEEVEKRISFKWWWGKTENAWNGQKYVNVDTYAYAYIN
jgi:hypothetical protein